MYEINQNRINQHLYEYRAKNKQNQLMNLQIGLDKDNNWYVCFFVTTKRKYGFQHNVQTGKCGLSSLMWAKNCIIDWLDYIKTTSIKNRILYIYATDNRRMNAYKRGLLPLGFKIKEREKEKPLYIEF